MTDPAIRVQNLEKAFKVGFFLQKKPVLKSVSFEVPNGSVTGFIGANGAGKTTILKCLLQVIFPDSGDMEIFSQKISEKSVRKDIGFLPERPYFHEFLTGEEFLRFHGRLMGLSGSDLKQRSQEVLYRVGLEHAGDKKLKSYSKGMLQRVGIGQALMVRPKLLILDEPMSGLDPDGRLLVKTLIKEIAKEGTTVFFSSHLLHDAEALCDHLVCLRQGEVVYNGPMQVLLQKGPQEVQVSYSQQGQNHEVSVEQEKLQGEIDRLRESGSSILEIKKKQKMSLEEAVSRL